MRMNGFVLTLISSITLSLRELIVKKARRTGLFGGIIMITGSVIICLYG